MTRKEKEAKKGSGKVWNNGGTLYQWEANCGPRAKSGPPMNVFGPEN